MTTIGFVRFRSAISASDPSLKLEEKEFLSSIDPEGEFTFDKPGKDRLNVFFIQTGGTEVYFKDIYADFPSPYLLLVQPKRNSLAAALEILSFLHQNHKQGYILQGNPKSIREKLREYALFFEAKKKLAATRLGMIGKPSNWLIASNVDKKDAKQILGVELVNIPQKEFLDLVDQHILADEGAYKRFLAKTRRKEDLRQSLYIHGALKNIVDAHHLDGFALRCFDLLKAKQQTSCLAFGMLNEEGITAACEGDAPALLTMHLALLALGQPSFMANPAVIVPEDREAIYAHCTCPLSMLTSYTLATHFESGLGFGIRGQFKEEGITLLKIKNDLSSIRAIEGRIIENPLSAAMCRSQIKVAFDEPIDCLIDDPYGNHMIFVYGKHGPFFKRLFQFFLDSGKAA